MGYKNDDVMEGKVRTGLRKHTNLGITWGELISLIGLFSAIVTAWGSINVQIVSQETINEQQEIRISLLESGRVQNANSIQQLRIELNEALKQMSMENREDHIRIMDKQESLLREMRKR